MVVGMYQTLAHHGSLHQFPAFQEVCCSLYLTCRAHGTNGSPVSSPRPGETELNISPVNSVIVDDSQVEPYINIIVASSSIPWLEWLNHHQLHHRSNKVGTCRSKGRPTLGLKDGRSKSKKLYTGRHGSSSMTEWVATKAPLAALRARALTLCAGVWISLGFQILQVESYHHKPPSPNYQALV